MRTTTGGSVPRVDLAPLLDLVPALWGEWDGLRFASTGDVIDPITDRPRPELRLTGGHHGRRGATYVALVAPTPPADEKAPERGPTEVRIELRVDDGRVVEVGLADATGHWSAEVTLRRGPVPHVDVTARADLRAMLRAEGTPGCAAGLLGRTARLAVTLDGSTLVDRRGDLLVATAGTRRFRGRAQVAVRPRPDSWEVTGEVVVRGRGLGGLVVTAIGSRLRRAVDDQVRAWWDDVEAWSAELQAELATLADVVRDEGGPAPFVRRAVWDPSFDPPSLAGSGGAPDDPLRPPD